jgi:hypothetical protein
MIRKTVASSLWGLLLLLFAAGSGTDDKGGASRVPPACSLHSQEQVGQILGGKAAPLRKTFAKTSRARW